MSDRYNHTEAVWDLVTHDHHGVPTPESLRTGLTQGFGGEGWVRLGHCPEDEPTAPLDSGPGLSGCGWAPAGSRVHRQPETPGGAWGVTSPCGSWTAGPPLYHGPSPHCPAHLAPSVPWVTAWGPRAHTCSSLRGWKGAGEEKQPPESQGPGEGSGLGAGEGRGRGQTGGQGRVRAAPPSPAFPAHQAPQPPPVTTPALGVQARGGALKAHASSALQSKTVSQTRYHAALHHAHHAHPASVHEGCGSVTRHPTARGCQSHTPPQRHRRQLSR